MRRVHACVRALDASYIRTAERDLHVVPLSAYARPVHAAPGEAHACSVGWFGMYIGGVLISSIIGTRSVNY